MEGLPVSVLLEREPDQWCAVGINRNGACLASVVVGAADVEIPDRGAHGCAALSDLLRQSFGDIGGEVGAVELGNTPAFSTLPAPSSQRRLSGRHEKTGATGNASHYSRKSWEASECAATRYERGSSVRSVNHETRTLGRLRLAGKPKNSARSPSQRRPY